MARRPGPVGGQEKQSLPSNLAGARIDYTVHGDGRSSSSVVLLAGFTAPATSWRYQIPSLIQSGHRVIAVDLPGHGTAPAMLPGTTMQTRAVVHAFIEQLDLQGAAMIGGSMGGSTIWSYVDTYGTGRLRAAVVVDQTPRMLNAPEWAYGFYGYDQEKVDTFFADGIPATGHGTPDLETRHAVGPPACRDRPRRPNPVATGTRPVKRSCETRLAFDARCERSSVLFVAGSDSESWPSAHAAAAAAFAPNGSSTVVARAGHATNMERPPFVQQLSPNFSIPRPEP